MVDGLPELGNMAVTMMACMGPAAETELTFMQALGSTDGFKIVGNQLRTYKDDAEVLIFNRAN